MLCDFRPSDNENIIVQEARSNKRNENHTGRSDWEEVTGKKTSQARTDFHLLLICQVDISEGKSTSRSCKDPYLMLF